MSANVPVLPTFSQLFLGCINSNARDPGRLFTFTLIGGRLVLVQTVGTNIIHKYAYER